MAWSGTAPAEGRPGHTSRCRPPTAYTSIAVGSLGSGFTIATDLNDHGLVVGRSEAATDVHGFRWRRGRMTDLTPPGGLYGEAIGTNDRGEVLHDWYDPTTDENRAFLWRNGRTTEIGTGPGSTYAADLNERGEVLLQASDGETAGLWRRGAIEPIPLREFGDFTLIPRYLGDGGHVIGTEQPNTRPGGGHPPPDRGFVWRDGVLTHISVSPLIFSEVVDVDRAGRVLVWVSGVAGGGTVLWDDGRIVDLGFLGRPSPNTVPSTLGTDINDRGQVVGSSTAASGEQHAFLWEDGRMTDLHPITGVTSSATAVNQRGDAVGTVSTTLGERIVVWSCGRMVDVAFGIGIGYPIAINDRAQVLSQAGDQVILSTPVRR